MAKRKNSERRPQRQHKRATASQHDKAKRLHTRNNTRAKTREARVPLVGHMQSAIASLASAMDRRMAFRLAIIVSGMLLADDRRTASAWFVAGGVQDDWDRFYDALNSVGRISFKLATVVLRLIVHKLPPMARIVLGMDDSPTSRYGRHVEGAGVHHNPTPGPADGKWLYGHNWVCLALLAIHPMWGVIALPLLSMLYVRAVDVPLLAEKYDWEFQTKHQLGVKLMKWFMTAIRELGVTAPVWLAVDGAYAAAPFLRPMMKLGVTVVSRLRKDACLFDLPPELTSKKRGRPRTYGSNRISLAKRSAHKQGWETMTYSCRGVEVTRQYKSFLATSELTGGVIRVVILRFENDGWAPYFCTDPTVEVKDILETVAARWAIEEQFHDVKEIWGAGQQQVRNVWSSIGCWNLNGWLYTLVELASWDACQTDLTDRSDRPWDNPDRRPSHADRHRTIAREMLQKQFLSALPDTPDSNKLLALFKSLVTLAT